MFFWFSVLKYRYYLFGVLKYDLLLIWCFEIRRFVGGLRSGNQTMGLFRNRRKYREMQGYTAQVVR